MSLLHEVISGNIAANGLYYVAGGTSIIYNGNTILAGSFFTGVDGVLDYAKTDRTEIVTEASSIYQIAVGFEQTKYTGMFPDTARINQIAVGGEVSYYPEYTNVEEVIQNDIRNFIAVETLLKIPYNSPEISNVAPELLIGVTFAKLLQLAAEKPELSLIIDTYNNITKLFINEIQIDVVY